MKARAKKARRRAGDGSFLRGFVATACLAAFQDAARPLDARRLKRVLRHALQGGTALAAGGRAVSAMQRGDYQGVALAATAGAAGVLIIERMLRDGAAELQEQ